MKKTIKKLEHNPKVQVIKKSAMNKLKGGEIVEHASSDTEIE